MSSSKIELQASEWLARLDRAGADFAERTAFESWRGADPRHAAAFARLDATWQQLDRLSALRPVDGFHIPSPGTRGRARMGASRRLALAAAMVFVALAIAWLSKAVLAEKTYTTGKGGFQRVVLQDRSALELNTDTKVRVHFGRALRKIDLIRGEASFEVARDPTRPFVVAAGETAVRAVGTKFNVRRLERSVEVVVSEGKVLIGAPDTLERAGSTIPPSAPLLVAGQSATADTEGLKLRDLPRTVAARKLAWQERMLVFDNEPLTGVVAEFNRYNERRLVIADPAIAPLKIGGYFKPTNLDAFVSVLESNFGVRAATQGGQIALTGK